MNEKAIDAIESQEIQTEELDLFADEVETRSNPLAKSCISTAASISTAACL